MSRSLVSTPRLASGTMRDCDGEVTVEAEGLFILPRWAREELAKRGEAPPQYE